MRSSSGPQLLATIICAITLRTAQGRAPIWIFRGLPTSSPTSEPSEGPSLRPSVTPTMVPSSAPTSMPSLWPSKVPTWNPSSSPSSEPSARPSAFPSNSPSSNPSAAPTSTPSSKPSSSPSAQPTSYPSSSPSSSPSHKPSWSPSSAPSSSPTATPSDKPSSSPSNEPTSFPSSSPTNPPSSKSSLMPSSVASSEPSSIPSSFLRGQDNLMASNNLATSDGIPMPSSFGFWITVCMITLVICFITSQIVRKVKSRRVDVDNDYYDDGDDVDTEDDCDDTIEDEVTYVREVEEPRYSTSTPPSKKRQKHREGRVNEREDDYDDRSYISSRRRDDSNRNDRSSHQKGDYSRQRSYHKDDFEAQEAGGRRRSRSRSRRRAHSPPPAKTTRRVVDGIRKGRRGRSRSASPKRYNESEMSTSRYVDDGYDQSSTAESDERSSWFGMCNPNCVDDYSEDDRRTHASFADYGRKEGRFGSTRANRNKETALSRRRYVNDEYDQSSEADTQHSQDRSSWFGMFGMYRNDSRSEDDRRPTGRERSLSRGRSNHGRKNSVENRRGARSRPTNRYDDPPTPTRQYDDDQSRATRTRDSERHLPRTRTPRNLTNKRRMDNRRNFGRENSKAVDRYIDAEYPSQRYADDGFDDSSASRTPQGDERSWFDVINSSWNVEGDGSHSSYSSSSQGASSSSPISM